MSNNDNDSDDNDVDELRLHVIVIVLGDLGRSPRMQYHALSLLEAGHNVTLIGYDGESLIPPLSEYNNNKANSNRLYVIRMTIPSPPMKLVEKVTPLYFAWRIVILSVYLFCALCFQVELPLVDCLLVQNPPALPLLFVALLHSYLKGWLQQQHRPGLVIDWHNLGYSMLRDGSMVQKIAKVYELRIAPYASGHLCVTQAMKDYVQKECTTTADNNIQVLYDCPPTNVFQPLAFQQQHEIMMKLSDQLSKACPKSWLSSITDPTLQNLFTEEVKTQQQSSASLYRPRKGRPALITSSTSWTPDEDFSILLDAVVQLDQQIITTANTTSSDALKVLVVVTGKGPEKEAYIEKISKLTLRQIAIQTVWLEPQDYPKLVACADIGISLHTSTSGLDLPMKILDLYGCQVPVCAIQFQSLKELVNDKVNGRIFHNSQELSRQLWDLLSPLVQQDDDSDDNNTHWASHGFGELKTYSNNLKGHKRWKENWQEHALPVILQASGVVV